MNPVICLYHRSDLDGHCSGAIVKKALPHAEMIGVEYGDRLPWEKFKNANIVMVDFSLEPFSDMHRLVEMAESLVWIDHHRTAINAEAADPLPVDRVIKVLVEGKAACELAWGAYFPDDEMPWAVNMMARYDVWQWKGVKDCLEFQYGARLQTTNPAYEGSKGFWRTIFEAHQIPELADEFVHDIITDGKAIIRYMDKQHERLMRQAHVVEFLGKKLLCVNASGINSLAFDKAYDPAKHDGVATFSQLPDKRWRFTLYSPNQTTDLSILALEMGGGGHPGACGFVTTMDDDRIAPFF